MPPGDLHQLAHLGVRNEGRRTAAPVQLLDLTAGVEETGLHVDLAVQTLQVRRGAATVLGHDLIAGTVVADRVAERQMEIQRQGASVGVAARSGLAVLGLAEAFVELHRRRIRGIAWAGAVIAADQFGIETDILGV